MFLEITLLVLAVLALGWLNVVAYNFVSNILFERILKLERW